MRAFTKEFRRDVVRVPWNSKEPRNKIAADFGVSGNLVQLFAPSRY